MSAAAVARDYSLSGPAHEAAIARGLQSAHWYRSPVPAARIKELMVRSDWPAARDTVLWFAAFLVTGIGGGLLWGSWWALPFFLAYGVLWGSSSDSRWHECGHYTAFKTRWVNSALYHLASFMVLREGTVWRRSHQRHHADTIIVGLDPEIAATRPPRLVELALGFVGLPQAKTYIARLARHARGRISPDERTYIPPQDDARVFWEARIHIAVYAAVIALALATRSLLPLMYVGLPSLYGAWLYVLTGLTQHAGLAENVLDHRLCARTIHMNRLVRFLYWNMNYHVEHHMFLMVPYHRLPELHVEMKADTPPPYRGLIAAFGEVVATLWRQRKDPDYFAARPLPPTARPTIAVPPTSPQPSPPPGAEREGPARAGG